MAMIIPAPTPMVRSNMTVSPNAAVMTAKSAARSAPKFDKGVRFGHANSDGKENRAERGEWNVANEWRGDERDEEKH